MKYAWLAVLVLLPLALLAQEIDPAAPGPEGVQVAQAGPETGPGPQLPGPGPMPGPGFKGKAMHGPGPDVMYRAMPPNEGRWWKNSEMAKQVGVSDAQVQQMEKIFQDSRIPLIDAKAELERQEARLEPLMESDNPDEKQIASQIDKVASARAGLEKTHALMLVSIRRVLTLDQWKKLQAIQPMHGPMKVMMVPPPHMPAARTPGAQAQQK